MRSWLRGREPGGDQGGLGDEAARIPAEGDESPLSRWLAPTEASQIDQIQLGEVHDGWTPERAGETPLVAMMALVRAVGVVDPILLRPRAEGGYEVITGHRTVAAARAVGCERIPAVVREMDDVHALVALALDGTATGRVTDHGAAEFFARLRSAGMDDEAAVRELLTSLGIDSIPETAALEAMAAAEIEEEATEPRVAGSPAPEIAAPAADVEVPATPAPRPEVPATPEPQPEVPATPAPQPEVPATPVLRPEVPAAREPEPEPMPVTATAVPAGAAAEGALGGVTPPGGRWVPMPAGQPRLARLSSAFADTPRMLRLLAADRFTGVVELSGRDDRTDVLTFLDGRCIAVSVEDDGQPVDRPLRLPGPERGPVIEINVRPHAGPIVVALALALRGPALLTGLHASFVRLPGLLEVLARERADAACVVSTPTGAGVILLSGGVPVAAYARRQGEVAGEVAETTDVGAVAGLLAAGEGDVDVHRGTLPPPYDLEALIGAAAQSG